MSTKDNEVVDEWLARFNGLQPADGKLTAEIIAAAGPFPVYRPPGDAYDNRNDEEKAYQYHVGSVARVYAREMAQFHMQQAVLRSEKSTGNDAEKHNVNAQYWSQILTWLKTIQ